MAEKFTTYVVYFRNGGQAEIACNGFCHEPEEKRVRFITGKRNVAFFETDAIVGFFEKQARPLSVNKEGGGGDG